MPRRARAFARARRLFALSPRELRYSITRAMRSSAISHRLAMGGLRSPRAGKIQTSPCASIRRFRAICRATRRDRCRPRSTPRDRDTTRRLPARRRSYTSASCQCEPRYPRRQSAAIDRRPIGAPINGVHSPSAACRMHGYTRRRSISAPAENRHSVPHARERETCATD